MRYRAPTLSSVATMAAAVALVASCAPDGGTIRHAIATEGTPTQVTVHHAVSRDLSEPLQEMALGERMGNASAGDHRDGVPPFSLAPASFERDNAEGDGSDAPRVMHMAAGADEVEQRTPGGRPAATLVASFDGLGLGFNGPQGTATVRNPSDNSLAVGPDHIVQVVNSRMAIFSKQGRRYPSTGTDERPLRRIGDDGVLTR